MSDKKSLDPPIYSYGDNSLYGIAPPPPYTPEIIATSAVPAPPPYVPPNVPLAPKLSWLERSSQNKPQSNSVGGASLIFIIAGMNMSYSAYTSYETNSIDFFIGAMIGALVGAVINTNIKRKYVIMCASMLTAIDGIIYMAASQNYGAVTAARYFDGLAFGVVFTPTMILIGEESVKQLRGMLASSIDLMCFYTGIAIQSSFNESLAYGSINAIQMQGMMNIIFGLLGIAVMACLHIESPIYHLQRGEEEQAIECLARLQTPRMVTTETYEQLQDHKRYLEENNALTPRHSVKQSLPALAMLVFYRSWVALSFSAVTYGTIMRATSDGMAVLYTYLSFVSALIVCFLMDSIGRIKPTAAGAFTCSLLAIIVGLFTDNVFHVSIQSRLEIVTWLLMAYSFFSAFSTLASSVYLTEAFPLSIKPYCISISFMAQMLIQLIINCFFEGASVSVYFYISAVVSMILSILATFVLPETKKVSLITAQNMFKQLFKRQVINK